MSQLKAEFKKLLTVRSTYLLTIFVWLAIAAISFIIAGLVKTPHDLQDPAFLQNALFGSLKLASLIAAIVGILLVAHEYRYNTINFSFTLSRSRSKVLFSKYVVVTVYSVVLSLVSVGIVIGGVHAGALVQGTSLGPQVFHVFSSSASWFWLTLQSVFEVWGWALAGLIVTVLLRNLVASIAFVFIFPSLENLIMLISKTLVSYLPFTSLNAVIKLSLLQPGFSVGKSMIIFLIYLVVFTVIAWKVFQRCDAN